MKDKRDACNNNETQYSENTWWIMRPCRINFTGMTVLWLKHRLFPQAHEFEQSIISWWCYFRRLRHLWKVEPWWGKFIIEGRHYWLIAWLGFLFSFCAWMPIMCDQLTSWSYHYALFACCNGFPTKGHSIPLNFKPNKCFLPQVVLSRCLSQQQKITEFSTVSTWFFVTKTREIILVVEHL